MAEVPYVAGEEIAPTTDELALWTLAGPTGMDFASGPCPKCQHEFGVPIVVDIVSESMGPATVTEAVPGPKERATRRFTCACLTVHKEGVSGCGRIWLASIVRSADGAWTLVPAPDRSVAPALIALDAAAKDETTRVRTWGEKWLPAVAAIYGLFGLAGIVIAKDSVKDLPAVGIVAVLLLGAASIGAIVDAIRKGYEAAFGWLTVYTVANDEQLLAWYRRRRDAITSAPATMQEAIKSALTGLGLLLLAVVAIWLWPRDAPTTSPVEVAFNDGGDAGRPKVHCGTLLSSKDGKVKVQVAVGGTKTTYEIGADWITTVTPKNAC